MQGSSSTAARLRNLQPGRSVRDEATHRALGRWLWLSLPSCSISIDPGALGRVAKQRVLSSNNEGADRAFSGVVVER